MVECDGNYSESARNSLKRCKCGGSSGSRADTGRPWSDEAWIRQHWRWKKALGFKTY